ncbi:MAG: outer membrane lipoprotein-sorting protein [Myxococcota bacterium]|nr:outer membrane lipoprotein-sorting protein [Myxococcota bacterium]
MTSPATRSLLSNRFLLAPLLGLIATFGLLTGRSAAAAEPVPSQTLLEQIDARMHTPGDFKAIVYLDEKQRDKRVTRQVVVHRRALEDKFLLLVTHPKTEAGNGYLRVDSNLFQYDTKLGKWERRTERDQLAGTNARRRDFDEARYSKEYDAKDEGKEKLGKMTVRKLSLTAKEGLDLPFPKMTIWVDGENNIRKTQEYALSDKLMRTSLIPKYGKTRAPDGQEVWYPREIRIFDEVEKERSTVMLFKSTDLKKLDDSTFTKAWMEGQTR